MSTNRARNDLRTVIAGEIRCLNFLIKHPGKHHASAIVSGTTIKTENAVRSYLVRLIARGWVRCAKVDTSHNRYVYEVTEEGINYYKKPYDIHNAAPTVQK